MTNTGQLAHEFTIGDLASQQRHEREMQRMPSAPMHDDGDGITLAPGQRKTLRLTPTRAGQLLYGCHVPGHWAAGMRGTIAVSG